MKNIIIYAHPDFESHNSNILAEVKSFLESKKQTYELFDLYSIKYNPILSKEEMLERKLDSQTKLFQKKILESDRIIFIYPVWWNGAPAILKGWFDRVLTPKFAYKYVNKFPGNLIGLAMPVPLLIGKKAVVFVSSGSPSWASKLLMGNRFKKIIGNDILKFCGISSKVYRVDKATKLTDNQKIKIKKMVAKGLK